MGKVKGHGKRSVIIYIFFVIQHLRELSSSHLCSGISLHKYLGDVHYHW